MQKHFRVLLTSLGFCLFCGCKSVPTTSTSATVIPFRYFSDTFIVVPVTIDGSVTKDFILDTGAGTNLISKSVSAKLGTVVQSKFSGKRMSGQEIEIPMSTVKSLSLGGFVERDVPVGIFDLDGLVPGANIGGILSLGFFKGAAFTIDYDKRQITIEPPEVLKKIRADGVVVPVKLDVQGPSLGILMPLVLPNGKQVSVEVDTGSQALILDEKYMHALGISPHSTGVKVRDGKDETGHVYKRFFTKLNGTVHLPQAPEMGLPSLDVMFQKIIYDGLVGHYFLEKFLVTYNIPDSEMIFRKR